LGLAVALGASTAQIAACGASRRAVRRVRACLVVFMRVFSLTSTSVTPWLLIADPLISPLLY
jgi:hypothetical protein